MTNAEAELALQVITMTRSVATYLRNREIPMEQFYAAMRQADEEGREFDLNDLKPLVQQRKEAAQAVDDLLADHARSGR